MLKCDFNCSDVIIKKYFQKNMLFIKNTILKNLI